jgi:uncharacterized protein YjbJ (UPF0337 family)
MEQPKSKVGAFKIVGNWDVQSKALKEKFPQLTDADLKFENGKEDELLARVEKRLNKKRDGVISLLKKGQLEKV